MPNDAVPILFSLHPFCCYALCWYPLNFCFLKILLLSQINNTDDEKRFLNLTADTKYYVLILKISPSGSVSINDVASLKFKTHIGEALWYYALLLIHYEMNSKWNIHVHRKSETTCAILVQCNGIDSSEWYYRES